MNAKGRNLPAVAHFPSKQFLLAPLLALSCALLTGCPRNDYTVELTPGTNGVERTLTFYRADGDSNGVPNYQDFPANELSAITGLYPPGAVKPDGKRYVARGKFFGPLPGDVGGAGAYTNLITSLGNAGFYVERFRGHDDLVANTTRQFATADKITDLVIGWARTEFGHDRGWKNLHRFLDENVRHDLKNAGLYYQLGAVVTLYETNAPDEFFVRFGQYLLERGYFRLADAPQLYASDGASALALMQRLAADKMGVSTNEPLPKSFAVFTDTAALEKSWTNYLARTSLYRDKLKDWEKKRKAKPDIKKPEPSDVTTDLLEELLEPLNLFGGGDTDHLVVKLALDRAPIRSNGRWRDGQVIWEANLDANRALPVLCYAGWSRPDTGFQESHFGKVVLEGDGLMDYCLWFHGLTAQQAGDWEKILAGLSSGEALPEQLEAFKHKIKPDDGNTSPSNTPPEESGTNSVSKQPGLVP
jgi:hypothetical protein